MAQIEPTMTLTEVSKMDGVKDLKSAAKVKFCKALLAEAKGNTAEANQFLDEAIAAQG